MKKNEIRFSRQEKRALVRLAVTNGKRPKGVAARTVARLETLGMVSAMRPTATGKAAAATMMLKDEAVVGLVRRPL